MSATPQAPEGRRAAGERAPRFNANSLDTAKSLRFIHLKHTAGEVPAIGEFLNTPDGQWLVQKYWTEQPVRNNFAKTLGKYQLYLQTGGGKFLLLLCLLCFQPMPHHAHFCL
jgi:hypothetical protein